MGEREPLVQTPEHSVPADVTSQGMGAIEEAMENCEEARDTVLEPPKLGQKVEALTSVSGFQRSKVKPFTFSKEETEFKPAPKKTKTGGGKNSSLGQNPQKL